MKRNHLYRILLIFSFFTIHFVYMTILIFQYDPSGQILSFLYLLVGVIYFIIYSLIESFVYSEKPRRISQEVVFYIFGAYLYFLQSTDITYMKSHILYSQSIKLTVLYLIFFVLCFVLFRVFHPLKRDKNETSNRHKD